MRKIDIELWARDIINRVTSGQKVEDDRVELKSVYIEPGKMARVIAGHCNSAGAEPVLLLLGVDDKRGIVPGVNIPEFSSWYKTIESQFNEIAPEIEFVHVPCDGRTVVALLIESEMAPYVIKNPKGGSPEFEVPWRVGTNIRTAKRSQLLRILGERAKLPTIEITFVRFTLVPVADKFNTEGVVFIEFFLSQPQSQETVFARHLTEVEVSVADFVGLTTNVKSIYFGNYGDQVAGRKMISITGSEYFTMELKVSSIEKPSSFRVARSKAFVAIALRPSTSDVYIRLAKELNPPMAENVPGQCIWEFRI
jgi:hypothetical protein